MLCQFMPLTDHQVEANVAVLLHFHSVSSYKRINIRAEEMSIKEATYLFIAKTNTYTVPTHPGKQVTNFPVMENVCGGERNFLESIVLENFQHGPVFPLS